VKPSRPTAGRSITGGSKTGRPPAQNSERPIAPPKAEYHETPNAPATSAPLKTQLSMRRTAAGGVPPLESLYAWAGTWCPTVSRVLLGVVLAWFGYHELVSPGLWTGYVPGFAPGSSFAEVLVLAHGWALLILAVALIAGIAPRLAAAVTALLLLEIVIALAVSHGLSDLVLRDVGVLGLSLAVVGQTDQRWLLRN
jgi:uncharacterized membrane protein YphA (DoxX/SURF4 family)